MKKITSFLMLFLMCFGMAWAQQADPLASLDVKKAFTLTAKVGSADESKAGLCVIQKTDGTFEIQSLNQANLAPSETDSKQQFAFVRYQGHFYLYSIFAKQYVKKDAKLSAEPVDPIYGKKNGEKIYLLMGTDYVFNVNGVNNLEINGWAQQNAGNCYRVKPVAEFTPLYIPFKDSKLDENGKFGADMHWYTMTIRGGAVKYNAGNNINEVNESFATEKNGARLYAFVGDAQNGYAIYNYAATEAKILWKATAADNNDAVLMLDKATDAKDAKPWSVHLSQFDAGYVVKWGGGDWYLNKRDNHLAFWNGNSVGDVGSHMVFTEVSGAELDQYMTTKVDVTVEHKCNGVLFQTNKVTKVLNEKLGDLSTLVEKTNRLGLAFVNAEGPTTATQNAVVTYNYNVDLSTLPFTVTASSDQPVWYMVDIHSNENAYFLKHNGGNLTYDVPAQKWNDVNAALNADYQWCIMGDPVNGFQIFNKTVNFEKALNSTDKYVQFGTKDTESALWYACRATGSVQNAVCFMAKDGDPAGYMNTQNNQIKYWGSSDEGSSCRFIPVGQPMLNLASDMYATPGAVVGSKSYFKDPIKKSSFNQVYESLNSDKHNSSKIEALKTMYDAAIATEDVVFDATKLYRIKNALNNGFLDVEGTKMVPSTDANSLNTIWSLSAANGAATVKHMNSNLYASSISKGVADGTMADADGGFSVQPIGGSKTHFGIHKSGMYLCHNKNANAIMGWNDAKIDNDHSWYLIPVETIDVAMKTPAGDNNSYASLYVPFGIGVREGTEAFTATIETMTKIQMHSAVKVPANNGMVLKAGKDVNKVTLDIVTDAPALGGENCLEGVNIATAKDTKFTYYVLNQVNNKIGFYTYTGTTMAANRAFVKNQNPMTNGFVLDFGETTGVESVEFENPAAGQVIYDMTGRRVAKMTKGLYIVNGKKVLVK